MKRYIKKQFISDDMGSIEYKIQLKKIQNNKKKKKEIG